MPGFLSRACDRTDAGLAEIKKRIQGTMPPFNADTCARSGSGVPLQAWRPAPPGLFCREILDSLHEQYPPQDTAEQFLVDKAAIAQWKLVRLEVFESKAYTEETELTKSWSASKPPARNKRNNRNSPNNRANRTNRKASTKRI